MTSNAKLSIAEVEQLAWTFLENEKPPISRYRFSSARFFDSSHHFASLRNTWNIFYDFNEAETLASSASIVVNIDDATGLARWPIRVSA